MSNQPLSPLTGALVLAHSLRDAGTTKKIVILVTTDTVSNGVINQLRVSKLRKTKKDTLWSFLHVKSRL